VPFFDSSPRATLLHLRNCEISDRGSALLSRRRPVGRAIWVAALGVATLCWRFSGGDRKLRAAGIVFAALSVQELWGRIFFDLFALPLLRAETAVVGTMLRVVRAGTEWRDNVISGPSGHGIVVYDYCSSFHNLSLAALCWLTVRSLRDQSWQARDLVIGCVVGITMILFNVTRLCLMAWDANLYHYWHDGAGVQIFNIGASVTILLMSLYGSRSAGRPA
jgi:Transmembrane exosortase (Exosortase_EpsH)